jgi:uncharacterized membrane protein YphA (DoxX/SURF4 family)
MKKYYPHVAKPLLRIALSLVFLYFGFSQIISPDNWAGFVPNFLNGSIFSANNWVVFNGMLEITLGIFLLIGLYTRFASLILSIHLFFIAISIGFSPLGIRDFGLALATLAVFFNGTDVFCIESGKKLKKK